MANAQTCPHCGALIVAQLARCRRCKTYLHGTALEGALLDLLPAQYAGAPATALLVATILLYYFIMVAMSGPANLIGFSSYTLERVGALHGPALLQGQHWRYLTYMFGHHDLLHLAFNLSALTVAGPVVERLFDRKKMFLTYLAAGVVAGLGSLVYYVYIRGGPNLLFVSAGASGSVSGMIGAALFGARRQGREGKEIADRMVRWSFSLVIWGFAVPGINNAAHLTGFLAGAACARLFALGPARSIGMQRALSAAAFAGLGLVLVGVGFMLAERRGFPSSLVKDTHSRDIFGFIYYHGVDSDDSNQKRIWDACINNRFTKPSPLGPAELLHACELNLLVNGHDPRSYTELAELLEGRGDAGRAATLRKIAGRL